MNVYLFTISSLRPVNTTLWHVLNMYEHIKNQIITYIKLVYMLLFWAKTKQLYLYKVRMTFLFSDAYSSGWLCCQKAICFHDSTERRLRSFSSCSWEENMGVYYIVSLSLSTDTLYIYIYIYLKGFIPKQVHLTRKYT